MVLLSATCQRTQAVENVRVGGGMVGMIYVTAVTQVALTLLLELDEVGWGLRKGQPTEADTLWFLRPSDLRHSCTSFGFVFTDFSMSLINFMGSCDNFTGQLKTPRISFSLTQSFPSDMSSLKNKEGINYQIWTWPLLSKVKKCAAYLAVVWIQMWIIYKEGTQMKERPANNEAKIMLIMKAAKAEQCWQIIPFIHWCVCSHTLSTLGVILPNVFFRHKIQVQGKV